MYVENMKRGGEEREEKMEKKRKERGRGGGGQGEGKVSPTHSCVAKSATKPNSSTGNFESCLILLVS